MVSGMAVYVFKKPKKEKKNKLFRENDSFSVAKSPINVFTSPANVGLYATRNFYITHYDLSVEMDITMGVWHILPNYVAAKFCKELCLTKVYIPQMILDFRKKD